MCEDSLFVLIKTLTKAEKRNFKLYVTKSNSNSPLYVKLFDTIDKIAINNYHEKYILKKNPTIRAQQLPNLKVHLYHIILTCLRLIEKEKNKLIQVREEMDYAMILYARGMYKACLKILEKIKSTIFIYHDSVLLLEVLEFEKHIALRHNVSRAYDDSKLIAKQTKELANSISKQSNLSSICLNMYALYLQFGVAKNEKDKKFIEHFFKLQIQNIEELLLSDREKTYFYHTHTLYYYLIQNFASYYKHANKWAHSVIKREKPTDIDLENLLAASHHLLNALFFLSADKKLEEEIQNLENQINKIEHNISINVKSQIFIELYVAKINLVFLKGNFEQGIKLIPEIEKQLNEFLYQLDTHQILIFYYKIASIYFGYGDYEGSIKYLNKIINLKSGKIRIDLQCFSRMLHLISHFELKNYDILKSLAKSLLRFLLKHKNNTKIIVLIISFLKNADDKKIPQVLRMFKSLHQDLKKIMKNPFEKRDFLYLDIMSFLESKIENKTIAFIIKEKYCKGIKRF